MTQQMPPEQPGQMTFPAQGSGAPEKKKSWFARHKVLTGLGGAIVLIIVISVAAGGGDKGSDEAGAGGASETTTTSENAPSEAEKPAASGAPGIGTAVESGGFAFTVISVEEAGAEVGGEYFQTAAQGRFVRVTVNVANIGDSPKYFFTNALTLVDEKGRSFNADTTATLYDQSNSDVWITEINPGNAIEGGIIFDLPADAVATTLKVSGGGFSGSEEINIAG
ncbi:DUF4352 domain-containing protein [Leucobacter insecticola]|uniref:DUF4352 domain-containing protein n=1 Tax=Leucobacter insecticola TaxID=2714934 RepID=A0A6G8FGH0_9MICO|nr:DUF4352 domain-containing protein [Leucobacter insecticola]QIM15437.1 DUF4352 domain-containing protein [Leucobacter insecticola]